MEDFLKRTSIFFANISRISNLVIMILHIYASSLNICTTLEIYQFTKIYEFTEIYHVTEYMH
jgi:hypothetical protein